MGGGGVQRRVCYQGPSHCRILQGNLCLQVSHLFTCFHQSWLRSTPGGAGSLNLLEKHSGKEMQRLTFRCQTPVSERRALPVSAGAGPKSHQRWISLGPPQALQLSFLNFLNCFLFPPLFNWEHSYQLHPSSPCFPDKLQNFPLISQLSPMEN